MNSTYQPLFTDLTLNNGRQLNNRLAMAPMLVCASDPNGSPSQLDLAYFARRNQVGDLLITGAVTIAPHINCAPNQLSFYEDGQIEAYAELAKVMKAKGSKAIVQIQHPGREAAVGYREIGKVVAPSALDFSFLNYVPEELTDEAIRDIIRDFGSATRRIIQAGFDGVEIHGANHYLIQQFFSAYSNQRQDFWGGSLEKRMNLALEIIKEIKRVRQELAATDFIIGFRLSPEEVHGENVGYTIDDTLALVDQILPLAIDYIHTSTFGSGNFGDLAYQMKGTLGTRTKSMNELIRERIDGKTAFMVSGSVNSAEAAIDALSYGDIVSMGVMALADPDFAQKIASGEEASINPDVTGRLEELVFPDTLIQMYQMGAGLPPVKGLL